jgi:ELWxxDGT repeat protein
MLGSQMVKEILPGIWGGFDRQGSGAPRIKDQIIALDSLLLFLAKSETMGWELWRSNGTDAGTFVLADIWPGEGNGTPKYFQRVGDKVFFIANDSIHGVVEGPSAWLRG